LAELANLGLVRRERGRGTVVTSRLPANWNCLRGFTEEVMRRGDSPRTHILTFRTIPAPAGIAKKLALPAAAPVRFIERLRFINEQPVCLSASYLPHHRVAGLDRSHFASTGLRQSLYYVLEHRVNILLDEGEEVVQAIRLTARQARYLRQPADAGAIRTTCLVRDAEGVPVLYDEAIWGQWIPLRMKRVPPFTSMLLPVRSQVPL